MDKTYIKRWKQKAFNPAQIDDTLEFLERPTYMDFPIDCIFSIEKNGDCTFYLEKNTMEKCTKFGKSFNWDWFIDSIYELNENPKDFTIDYILECYFLLQPEVVKKIENYPLNSLRLIDYFSSKDIQILRKSGYFTEIPNYPKLLDVLSLKRLLLRFKWEKYYYGKPYKPLKKKINYRLVREASKSVVDTFNGMEEVVDKPYYIFNPYKVDTISGIALNVDGGMDAFQFLIAAEGIHDKILIVPNARPELIIHFDIKNLVAFISEEGGATSHSIVIARERNIPCVVGVPGIMKMIKNGDKIEIDMKTGNIKKEK
jgi:phosphohistidine swiveling domain-containing protein